MPQTLLVFFRDDDGTVPVRAWLEELRKENLAAYKKCAAIIKELELRGHELRRPYADALRDGIRELRTKCGHAQYRILYFFNGRDFAVIAHAILKKGSSVPDADIERAKKRMLKFVANPSRHSWQEDSSNAHD